jgi:hypothetical protein
VSVLQPVGKQAAAEGRRPGVDRRAGERRAAARSSIGSGDVTRTGEWQRADRRRGDRRVDDVPFLCCPDCREGLQHDAALSWSLPGTYTVDAGYCPSCARRFLRNRETGEYDEMSW